MDEFCRLQVKQRKPFVYFKLSSSSISCRLANQLTRLPPECHAMSPWQLGLLYSVLVFESGRVFKNETGVRGAFTVLVIKPRESTNKKIFTTRTTKHSFSDSTPNGNWDASPQATTNIVWHCCGISVTFAPQYKCQDSDQLTYLLTSDL